jgi:ubiquinone/menaquinone biosynthesis C-methylase UbiE
LLNFDRIAPFYDTTRSLSDDDMRSVLETLSKAITDSHLILDAGVGTGRFAAPLMAEGFEIVGVDVSVEMMKRALEKGVENLVQADLHKLPLRSKSFDAFLMVHILHLVADWKVVVRETLRVCRQKLVAVFEDVSDFTIRRRYLELRSEYGLPTTRFDDGERGLAKILKPDKVFIALDRAERVNLYEELEHFEGLKSTITWEVPEETHSIIIARIKESITNKTLERKKRYVIASWSVDRLNVET